MGNVMNQFRQGDVLCQQVEKLPEGAVAKENVGGTLVLRHGSATGHSHAFKNNEAQEFTAGDDRFVVVGAGGAKLVHEEHSTIEFPEGVYQVVQQREFSPLENREVLD